MYVTLFYLLLIICFYHNSVSFLISMVCLFLAHRAYVKQSISGNWYNPCEKCYMNSLTFDLINWMVREVDVEE